MHAFEKTNSSKESFPKMKRPCENEPNQVAKKSPKDSQTTNDEPIDIDQLPPEKQLSMKVREKKQLVKVSY